MPFIRNPRRGSVVVAVLVVRSFVFVQSSSRHGVRCFVVISGAHRVARAVVGYTFRRTDCVVSCSIRSVIVASFGLRSLIRGRFVEFVVTWLYRWILE